MGHSPLTRRLQEPGLRHTYDRLEKPADFPDRGLFGARGLPSIAAIKAALVLALLIAFGVVFAILYPFVQASTALMAAAQGNAPMLLIGP